MLVETLVISLGANGRLLLPSSLRHRLKLAEGDRLIVQIEEDGVHLKMAKLHDQIAQAEGLYQSYAPSSGSVVDELITERRQQAANE